MQRECKCRKGKVQWECKCRKSLRRCSRRSGKFARSGMRATAGGAISVHLHMVSMKLERKWILDLKTKRVGSAGIGTPRRVLEVAGGEMVVHLHTVRGSWEKVKSQ